MARIRITQDHFIFAMVDRGCGGKLPSHNQSKQSKRQSTQHQELLVIRLAKLLHLLTTGNYSADTYAVEDCKFSCGSGCRDMNLKVTDAINSLEKKVVFFDESEPQYIDFEASEQGTWFTLKKGDNFNRHQKLTIGLALFTGFKWEDLEVTHHSDRKLEEFLNIARSNEEIDDLFDEALEYLEDFAYETDPGWHLSFTSDGLSMESIWTDEIDMWDEDRELKPLTPIISASAWREFLTLNL